MKYLYFHLWLRFASNRSFTCSHETMAEERSERKNVMFLSRLYFSHLTPPPWETRDRAPAERGLQQRPEPCSSSVPAGSIRKLPGSLHPLQLGWFGKFSKLEMRNQFWFMICNLTFVKLQSVDRSEGQALRSQECQRSDRERHHCVNDQVGLHCVQLAGQGQDIYKWSIQLLYFCIWGPDLPRWPSSSRMITRTSSSLSCSLNWAQGLISACSAGMAGMLGRHIILGFSYKPQAGRHWELRRGLKISKSAIVVHRQPRLIWDHWTAVCSEKICWCCKVRNCFNVGGLLCSPPRYVGNC